MMPQADTEPSTLDLALGLAAQGFRVFPLIQNGKLPAIGGWLQRATRDPEQIRKLWASRDPVLDVDRVKPYNIGIRTGDQGDGRFVTVVDTDVKDGRPGEQSLATLDMLEGTPGWLDTRVHISPTGSKHYFYVAPTPTANTASTALGAGIDTRGEGGYVVAPGSTIEGVPYRVVSAKEPILAPRWLLDKIGQPIARGDAGSVVELLDTRIALDRARDFLAAAAPAVEGQGGDALTFKTACKVGDLGVSELACLELLEGWNERCSPPWDYETLAVKVANAYAYRKLSLGERSAEGDFDPIPDDPGEPLPKRKLFYELAGEIEPDLTAVALIDECLDQGVMSVMYGQSNTGKTFVAMSMAYAISAAALWAGLKVQQGAVVYVAAEAGGSARKRVKGLRLHYKWDGANFFLVPCPVDLLRKDADTKPLIALIKEIEAKHGVKVVLVVIDTLSRAMAGGNENGPEDMGAFVSNIDRIRVATKAHTMLIHHSGKDEARGARGHSLLRAATDTEIEIADGVVRFKKQRDMEMGKPVGFRLESIELGRRPDGKLVTTAVAVMGAASAEADFADLEVTPAERQALDALHLAIRDYGRSAAGRFVAEGKKWRQVYKEGYAASGDASASFRKHRGALVHKLVVEEVEKDQWALC